jgi:hypothetical protein
VVGGTDHYYYRCYIDQKRYFELPPIDRRARVGTAVADVDTTQIFYFNGILLGAIYGGGAIVELTGVIAFGLIWSFVISLITTLLFPSVVDKWMARRA